MNHQTVMWLSGVLIGGMRECRDNELLMNGGASGGFPNGTTFYTARLSICGGNNSFPICANAIQSSVGQTICGFHFPGKQYIKVIINRVQIYMNYSTQYKSNIFEYVVCELICFS